MIDEVIEINMLLDFYKNLLSIKQEKAISMYYTYDYSLNEIAEDLNISKQAVSDNIKRAEQKLRFFEKNLNLLEEFKKKKDNRQKLKILMDRLLKKSNDIDINTFKEIYSIIFDTEEVY
ncbi:MAG: YlxM family DNA-binding protein [Peptoniphilaceae bacterium]